MLSIAVDLAQANLGRPQIQRTLTKRSFVVGSSPASDVVIEGDPGVARDHARVLVRRWDLAVVIRPIDGAVLVNAMPIESPTIVTPDDVVRIGDATLRFRASGTIAGGRRWWDPRDWGDAAVEAPRIPIPTMNPPAPLPVPDIDQRIPTMNPPAPEPIPPSNPPRPFPMPPGNPPPQRRPSPPLEPLPSGTRREVLSDDATEHALLAALRDAPNDPGARMVYADWLEARGRGVAAAAVRGHEVSAPELALATDAAWRAIACSAPIRGCKRTECPASWQALAAAGVEDQRACPACAQRVYFAGEREQLVTIGRHQVPVVIDPTGDRTELETAYDLGRRIGNY